MRGHYYSYFTQSRDPVRLRSKVLSNLGSKFMEAHFHMLNTQPFTHVQNQVTNAASAQQSANQSKDLLRKPETHSSINP